MPTRPYTVAVDDAVLADLRDRLARTRWTDSVAPGWDRGADVGYLQDLVAYWRDGYDWRAEEKALNDADQLWADVDTPAGRFGLHVVRGRSATAPGLPLLLLHGWPMTSLQMRKITPLLAAEGFDVVVPSLPDYGFSARPTAPGVSNGPVAEALHRLMTEELGHARYGVRASDIGAGVAAAMAMAHPEAVVGLHVSGSNPWTDLDSLPADLTAEERQMVDDARAFRDRHFAYALLQGTTPQTPAVALNDSPAGLAAWLVEKYRAWSDNDGSVEDAFTRDEILAELTVYWVTGTIGSSMRLYYENLHAAGGWGTIDVPTGYAMLPADFFRTPRSWVERTGRVDSWTELPRGGHFAEHEVPDLLAADIRAFFEPLR
ncbi:epoxide hydrolase family protein [Geodermatophilus sp. SYSU D00814]